jgi:hypothetical protein
MHPPSFHSIYSIQIKAGAGRPVGVKVWGLDRGGRSGGGIKGPLARRCGMKKARGFKGGRLRTGQGTG